MSATDVAKLQLNWPIDELNQNLSSVWGPFSVECLPSVDSTNSELQRRFKDFQQKVASIRKTEGEEAAQFISAPATLLIAETQTAGRGRHGKVWQSNAASSLTFSVGIPVSLSNWSGLSLVVGLAIAQALHPDIGLKWPNDLWMRAKEGGLPGPKLGGILIEAVSQAQMNDSSASKQVNISYLIVGVGINIAPQQYPELDQAMACVQDVLPQALNTEIILPIASSILKALEKFQDNDQGFLPFHAEFVDKDVLAGHPVVLSDGREGWALGVDTKGQLLVKTEDHTEAILSGEVSVRPVSRPESLEAIQSSPPEVVQNSVASVIQQDNLDQNQTSSDPS